MSGVKAGDRIAVHYRACAAGGELLACSEGGPALEMRAGGDEVIRGMSLGVIGMQVGEERTLQLAPEEAYGERAAFVERTIPREHLPAGIVVGDVVRISVGGMSALLWVVELVEDTHWRVSTGHPLAGRAVELRLQLVACAG